jgi:hypothetical protein
VRHTAKPLVPGPSRLEVETAIAKLKKNKSPSSDQIPAELIQAGGEILLSANHKLINSVWNKGKKRTAWSVEGDELLYQFKKRMTKLTVLIIVGYHCYHLHVKFYGISFSQG